MTAATVQNLLSMLTEVKSVDTVDPFQGYTINDTSLSTNQVSDLYDFLLWNAISDAVRASGWSDFTEWSAQEFHVHSDATVTFLESLKERVQTVFDSALATRQAAVKVWIRADADLDAAVKSKQYSEARVVKAEAAVTAAKAVFNEADAVFMDARRVEEYVRPILGAYSQLSSTAVIALYRSFLSTDKWDVKMNSYNDVVTFVKTVIL